MSTELLDLARTTARAAGDLLEDFARRRREGADLGVATKSSATDPVSEADRAAERLIADALLTARPDDGLLGEEGQASRGGTSGLRWVVDPLDGTVNFLYDRADWCVSIAAEDDDGAVVGVVHQPRTGETFVAERGAGAHLETADGRHELHVTQVDDLAKALVATGFAYDAVVRADQGRDVADLVGRVRDVRRCGSAALDLAGTAAGRSDAYLEFAVNPWDWAAGALLVTEAGGTLSQVEAHLGGRDTPGIVAGGRVAHDALRAWLTAIGR
ncbi:inositol monophosphatase [Nitriliruptoraceae bacterium ZYF776]|nr:inositol monophosphatase [Profundirhabdus halotolerans]